MLDTFLRVVYEREKRASEYQQMVQDMTHLPKEELEAIANGELKIAMDDEEWLEKFEETPLYDQALQLEQANIELDIAEQQRRLQEKQEPEPDNEEEYRARDALRLKKRILELELNKMKLEERGAQSEEPEPEVEEEEPEPPPAAEEESEEPAEEEVPEELPKAAASKLRGAYAQLGKTASTKVDVSLGDTSDAAIVGGSGLAGALGGGAVGRRLAKRFGPKGMGPAMAAGAALGGGVGVKGGRRLAKLLEGRSDEKTSAVLTGQAREKIKSKHFAVKPKGGDGKYPIHDASHARNALVRVRQFGSPSERSRVYSAVAKKYPALATRSSVVPAKQQRKAEKKLGLGKGQQSQKKEKALQKVGEEKEALGLVPAAKGLLSAGKGLMSAGTKGFQQMAGQGLRAQAAGAAGQVGQAWTGLAKKSPGMAAGLVAAPAAAVGVGAGSME